jgi:hypothetical protein
LAAQLFPEGRAVGGVVEMLSYRGDQAVWERMQVRGVVEQVLRGGARSGPRPTVYANYWQHPTRNLTLVARVRGNPGPLLDDVRTVGSAVDPEIAPFGVRTLEDVARDLSASDRALAGVCTGFSAVAFLLAGLGLFGLVARQIPLRRREMGIRLALGARPADLVVALTRDGLVIGIGALLLGVPLSLFTVQILEDTLFQLETTDPLSIGVGCVAVILLYLIASWLPAGKVSDMDPAASLTVQ